MSRLRQTPVVKTQPSATRPKPLCLLFIRSPCHSMTYDALPISPDHAQTNTPSPDSRAQIPPIDRRREPRSPSSGRGPAAQFYQTISEMTRQGALGPPQLNLARLAKRPLHRTARDGHPLASPWISLLLEVEEPEAISR